MQTFPSLIFTANFVIKVVGSPLLPEFRKDLYSLTAHQNIVVIFPVKLFLTQHVSGFTCYTL